MNPIYIDDMFSIGIFLNTATHSLYTVFMNVWLHPITNSYYIFNKQVNNSRIQITINV